MITVGFFESNEISPKDALVYIDSRRYDYRSYDYPVMYLFPLMDVFNLNEIVQSYLDKLGFYNPDYEVYPDWFEILCRSVVIHRQTYDRAYRH